jgi:hypothetical protein
MPYRVEKRKGKRPYKIVNTETGKVVGSSTSREAAKSSIRARHAGKRRK